LLRIATLPASQVKPTSLNTIVDRDNATSMLLMAHKASRWKREGENKAGVSQDLAQGASKGAAATISDNSGHARQPRQQPPGLGERLAENEDDLRAQLGLPTKSFQAAAGIEESVFVEDEYGLEASRGFGKWFGSRAEPSGGGSCSSTATTKPGAGVTAFPTPSSSTKSEERQGKLTMPELFSLAQGREVPPLPNARVSQAPYPSFNHGHPQVPYGTLPQAVAPGTGAAGAIGPHGNPAQGCFGVIGQGHGSNFDVGLGAVGTSLGWAAHSAVAPGGSAQPSMPLSSSAPGFGAQAREAGRLQGFPDVYVPAKTSQEDDAECAQS